MADEIIDRQVWYVVFDPQGRIIDGPMSMRPADDPRDRFRVAYPLCVPWAPAHGHAMNLSVYTVADSREAALVIAIDEYIAHCLAELECGEGC